MTTYFISLHDAAEQLATESRAAEPEITRTYLFKADNEIRLIHVDPTSYPVRPEEGIRPFYFGAGNGIPYRTAVALVRPEDVTQYTPPSAWGTWQDAEIIWEKK